MSSNLLSYIYLHSNGALIYKPHTVFYHNTAADYFDSSFVIKYWKQGYSPYELLEEALALTSDTERTRNDFNRMFKDTT